MNHKALPGAVEQEIMTIDELYEQAKVAVAAPYEDLFNIHLPLSFYYLATSFLIVAVWAWRSRRMEIKKALKFLFPKEVYLHPSALFDLQYYLIARPVSAMFFAVAYLPGVWLNDGTFRAMTWAFGPSTAVLQPGVPLMVLETICYVLVFDLGYWARHWAMHRVPWLWEFHKAHHSAEVMTPLTTLRGHPVDEITQSMTITFSTGLVHGVFLYLNGPQADSLTLLQTNAIMLVYYLTFFNLRHSHYWIVIDGPLGHIIQSPAHHQIHHSNKKKHWDKNFGYCLSLWDWVFGTLYMPKRDEKVTFGIGAESPEYRTLRGFLFLPFIKIARQVRARRSGASQGGSTEAPQTGTSAPPQPATPE